MKLLKSGTWMSCGWRRSTGVPSWAMTSWESLSAAGSRRPAVGAELDPRLVAVGRAVRVGVAERPRPHDDLDVHRLAGPKRRQGRTERNDFVAPLQAEQVD